MNRIVFPRVAAPRVSVLLVTYGGWDFVSTALGSLLENTEPYYEVIIVDNASPDETAARLKEQVANARLVFNESNIGFGPAANQAASLARAPYLALLNSDCFVRPGWLPPLVEALEESERRAAVAPVVLNPDGSLQEAGCLLFGNGQTQLFGEGDDAGRPDYRFRRIVDYASAACLLLRRRAFFDVGGFDVTFVPAYFEDVDLCLCLRQMGLGTLFEPRSVVTHLRGASGGGTQALETWSRNLALFKERWKEVITGRPMPGQDARGLEQTLSARDAMADARILVIGDWSSDPGAGAAKVSVLPLLSTLVAGWPDCRISALIPTLPLPSFFDPLLQKGIEIVAGISDPAAWLHGRRFHYDVVLCERGHGESTLDVALRSTQPDAVYIESAARLDDEALVGALSEAGIAPPRQPLPEAKGSAVPAPGTSTAGGATNVGRPIALIVLGMHRSGTSALTACLRFLGVPLGRPLMPANFANRKGFFEHAEIVAIHDELLRGLGASALDVSPLQPDWERSEKAAEAARSLEAVLRKNFDGIPCFAVKDPRLCVLLPLWLPLLEKMNVEARFILMLRSPWEIARSLESRDGIDIAEALDLWLRHVAGAESATRQASRAVLSYDGLLSGHGEQLTRLGNALAVSWIWPPTAVRREIAEFLNPSFRHFSGSTAPPGLPENLVAAVNQLETAFDALIQSDHAAARSLVDDRRVACEERLEPLRDQISAWDHAEDSFDVHWQSVDVPAALKCSESVRCRATFSNAGRKPLSQRFLFIACHWLDAGDTSHVVTWDDGLRTPVRRALLPGDSWSGEFTLKAPAKPGMYLLQVDLVREGVAWFGMKGVRPLTQPVTIT